jgi:phenylpyruvate tautomerase PptA (4-oxalocrotonate tautomerase family)
MPLVRITYPRGALTQDHKARLAESLTDIVLDAEVDAVTTPGRMVTVIQYTEASADDWAVAGVMRSAASDPQDHFIVDVIVLEALLDGARRADVHARVTKAFQDAFGDSADPMLPFRVWVLVHEVREGGWGAAGRTMSALDVAQFINSDIPAARLAEIKAALGR